MKTKFPLLLILTFVFSALVSQAIAGDTASHVKSVTAITQVFGDGQKVSAVAVEYDSNIDTKRLKVSDFQVAGRTVKKIYANTAAAQTPEGTNAPYIIVELETAMEPFQGHGPSGGPKVDKGPGQEEDNPAGFGGPTLGEKSDKPAQSPPVTIKITQSGDIYAANGEIFKADPRVLTNTHVINPVVDDFKQGIFRDPEYNNEKLMYNLFIPKDYDPAKTYPMVLFIHDAGAVSNNPVETLTQGLGAVVWATPAAQDRHECFVLAPQYDCVIVGDSSKTTEQVDMTVDLIKALMKTYSIDPSRIYNTGQSMGGMTSIAMDIKYPDLFAASFLVACQWDAAKVAPMASMPLWIIVSQGDTKASPGQDKITGALAKLGATVCRATWEAKDPAAILEKEVADMRRHGCQINYTTFKNGNHRYTWQYAYSIPGVREWLFEQTKGGGGWKLYAKARASRDANTAFGYYYQAAQSGSVPAQYAVGKAYERGDGVQKDMPKAMLWYKKAGAKGSNSALLDIGILYFRGEQVAQDYKQALEYFKLAWKYGHMKAPRYIGIIYEQGLGVQPDYTEALKFYKKASNAGDITAAARIGWLYERGLGVVQSYETAIKWYLKAAPTPEEAAENIHPRVLALSRLGYLYEKGLGVGQDTAKALAWYKVAAEDGDTFAESAVKRLSQTNKN
nr:alpha/beta hydrolase-fold protein [uncultured Desulfobacter sp.]